jgi:hypothetical protein
LQATGTTEVWKRTTKTHVAEHTARQPREGGNHLVSGITHSDTGMRVATSNCYSAAGFAYQSCSSQRTSNDCLYVYGLPTIQAQRPGHGTRGWQPERDGRVLLRRRLGGMVRHDVGHLPPSRSNALATAR